MESETTIIRCWTCQTCYDACMLQLSLRPMRSGFEIQYHESNFRSVFSDTLGADWKKSHKNEIIKVKQKICVTDDEQIVKCIESERLKFTTVSNIAFTQPGNAFSLSSHYLLTTKLVGVNPRKMEFELYRRGIIYSTKAVMRLF